MNEEKKLMSAIVIVAIAIFLVSGGTFAYWAWTTDALQNTLVSTTPLGEDVGGGLYIDFPSQTLNNLYPTSDCDPLGTSSWVTEITVDNRTGVLAAPVFKLKVKIEDKNGAIITNSISKVEDLFENEHPNRYYIKYAVTKENESCNNALFTGRFDRDPEEGEEEILSDWYESELITKLEGNPKFPIVSGKNGSGVSFHAKANSITTQRFKVYAWLSNEYTAVNVGGEIFDPLQDAKVTVSWSENSTLETVRKTKSGEAIAIYSTDDNSLRFYRETDDNISKLSSGEITEYNNRTVTKVYTGFETEEYTSFNAPWYNDIYGYGEFEGVSIPKYVQEGVEKIVFEDYIYPVSTAYWFEGFIACTYADVIKLDTSNVTLMDGMFSDAAVTNIVGIENWDTSNVTSMGGMFSSPFEDLTELTLDLRGWNVCKVTWHENFYDYLGSYPPNISEPYFGTSKCRGIKGEAIAIYSADDNSLRFYRTENPDTIVEGESYKGRVVTKIYKDIENNYSGFAVTSGFSAWGHPDPSLDVEPTVVVFEDYIYPTNISSWFNNMSLRTPLDVTKLDVSNVTEMRMTFFSFRGNIMGLENWDTSNVTNMQYMFSYVTEMKIENSSVIEDWDTSSVTDMYNMFANSSLELDLRGWNVCNVTNYSGFNSVNIIQPHFGNTARCNGNTNVGKENAVGNAYAVYFEGDQSLRFYRSTTEIQPESTFDGRTVTRVYQVYENYNYSSSNSVLWQTEKNSVKTIVFEDYIYPISTAYWFAYFNSITDTDVSKLDMSSVTSMYGMFVESKGATIVGIENWNTSNVKDMGMLFGYTTSQISTLDLSNWNTSNVTNMVGVFWSSNLVELKGLENWDTSNVTAMDYMFRYTTIGNEIDLRSWNVCKVTSPSYPTDFSEYSNVINPYFHDTQRCNGGLPAQ